MNNDLQHLEMLDEILQKLSLCGVSIMNMEIAGGAVRDMLLDRPIKDIDVFFEGKFDEELIKKHFTVGEESILDPDVYTTLDDDSGEQTWRVDFKRLSYEGCSYPIQLIKTKDLDSHIDKTFGCNLSKVAYGTGGLFLSNAFLADAYLKVLTFNPTASTMYKERIVAKYPDYAVNGECSEVIGF